MRTLALQYPLGTPDLAWAYAQVRDFERFGHHHPYMVAVERLPALASEAAAPTTRTRYTVRESIKLFGFIPQRPSYAVEVEETRPGEVVVYTAQIKKGLDLRLEWRAARAPDGAVSLHEHIELRGPRLLTWFFLKVLVKAHRQTVEQIGRAAPSAT